MRRVESADVQLVNKKILELRRYKSGLVPGKLRASHDAVRTITRKLTRIRIALVAGTSLTVDPELVMLPILHARDKAAPVPVVIGNERRVVANFKVIEIATDVDRARIRCPNAKRCAVGDEISSHRRAGTNVTKRSGNDNFLTDLPDSDNRHLFEPGNDRLQNFLENFGA